MDIEELGTYTIYFGLSSAPVQATVTAYKSSAKVLIKTADLLAASSDTALTDHLSLRWLGRTYVDIKEVLI